jgi:hypothetical protein
LNTEPGKPKAALAERQMHNWNKKLSRKFEWTIIRINCFQDCLTSRDWKSMEQRAKARFLPVVKKNLFRQIVGFWVDLL